MFDYKMLCKNQKTDFCSCNEDKLYQVKDGEFMKYDKNGNSKVTTGSKQGSNMAIALIIASTAVVLVAVAIILVVILFICRFKRASLPVEEDMWAQR